MKIRAGFVSNSSSSSFCIFGMYLGKGSCVEKLAYEIAKDTNLCVENGCNAYDDSVYIGMYPESMKEDETLRQFKERVLSQLIEKDEKYKDSELGWITDGGYDG
jgi:predicted PolB exonuclease-like 3'-5' exonuclease